MKEDLQKMCLLTDASYVLTFPHQLFNKAGEEKKTIEILPDEQQSCLLIQFVKTEMRQVMVVALNFKEWRNFNDGMQGKL